MMVCFEAQIRIATARHTQPPVLAAAAVAGRRVVAVICVKAWCFSAVMKTHLFIQHRLLLLRSLLHGRWWLWLSANAAVAPSRRWRWDRTTRGSWRETPLHYTGRCLRPSPLQARPRQDTGSGGDQHSVSLRRASTTVTDSTLEVVTMRYSCLLMRPSKLNSHHVKCASHSLHGAGFARAAPGSSSKAVCSVKPSLMYICGNGGRKKWPTPHSWEVAQQMGRTDGHCLLCAAWPKCVHVRDAYHEKALSSSGGHMASAGRCMWPDTRSLQPTWSIGLRSIN